MNSKQEPPAQQSSSSRQVALKESWAIVKRVLKKTGRDHISVVSAGCAFYALFAIFPALTASISLYGLTANPATIERQFGMLQAVLPPQGYEIVIEEIRRIAAKSSNTLGWSFVLSLIVALYSATLGTKAMFSALNIAYGERERRGFLHFYMSAVGATILGILGGVAMLFAIVYVPILFDDAGDPHLYKTIIKYVRWPVFVLFTLVLLAVIYRFGPSRSIAKWRWVSAGSVFAALVWLLTSIGFSYYVASFSHYDKMYGSLGAVIVLLLWLYISFFIVLIGAQINAQVEMVAEGTPQDASGLLADDAFLADDVPATGPRD
jgi:membrane protein